MTKMFLMGMLVVGVWWWPDPGCVLAAQPPSENDGRQFLIARDFERVILSKLTRQYGRPNHHLNVRIVAPKKPMAVPAGKLHLEIEKLTGGARMGRRAFRVGLFLNGQFIKTVNVVGEVKAQVRATAPTRWMKPKEVVRAEDITVIMVDVPSLTHDFMLKEEDVIGKQVLRSLSPRRPIRKIMLEEPPVVRKGDRVMLEVRRGGLLVQTIGLAKATGRSGDTILVQNKNSGREVIGTILGAGLVEVGF